MVVKDSDPEEKNSRRRTYRVESSADPMAEKTSNPISRTIEFWVDSIMGGHIIEIVVDTIKSYS